MTVTDTNVSAPLISGGLTMADEANATESTIVDDHGSEISPPDEPTIGPPDNANISPPDREPIRPPDRQDPAVAADVAFHKWWDANARFVADDAELVELLEWRAKVHEEIIRILYAQRLALLIEWRSEGLTLRQIADRSGLSYARVHQLMPEGLRPRRQQQDQGD